MLNRIFYKILILTNLMIMPIMKTMTSKLIVVLVMQLPFNLMSTVFYHINLFKYYNVKFNLKNMTKIHSVPSLVGYLLMALNRHF